MTPLIRHRVHLIVTAEQLGRPVSFRTDVILDRRDPDEAYRQAKLHLIDQDPLTNAAILQASSIDMTELPEPLTEVQPLGAGATADTPLPADFCTRVDYPARHRDDGPQPMSHGHWGTPPHGVRTMGQMAVYVAAETRVGHAYWGPMTVYVWPTREREHYRTPPPTDAYRLELGNQTDTIRPATKQAVLDLHQEDRDRRD